MFDHKKHAKDRRGLCIDTDREHTPDDADQDRREPDESLAHAAQDGNTYARDLVPVLDQAVGHIEKGICCSDTQERRRKRGEEEELRKHRKYLDHYAKYTSLWYGLHMQTALLLHNIRSAHNVGSIFRTADAVGVSRIFLSGYTPTPVDRFGRVQKEITKTALGAEKDIPWEYAVAPAAFIKRLKREGWRIVGVEQDARAIDYRALTPDRPTLFILGNEVRGISLSLRDQCDALIEIPMHGKKESLNVGVAAGIILFSTISPAPPRSTQR